jgi:PST family polysaccharide transporter
MTALSPAPGEAAEGLAHRAGQAARWRLLSGVLQGGLQFAVGVALARLLAPNAFGIATLASVVVGLAALLLDLGIGSAVIQRRELSDGHIRTAFSLGVVLGGFVMALLWVLAPGVAALVRVEALTPILRVESILFLMSGIGVTARALLQRRLSFRTLFLVDLLGYTIGYAAVALTLATHGFGVWSLVAGAVLQSLLSNGLVLVLVRHPVRLLLRREEATELLRFASGSAVNGAINHVAFHGDNLIVGRMLGTHALGLYARAFTLMMLPLGFIGNALFSILFPALSELQRERDRFARAYLTATAGLTLAMGPVLAAMAIAGPHLVVGLYGEPWRGSAAPFQVLCVVGLLRVAAMPAGAVTHASGQVFAELRRQVIYAAWVLVGSLLGSVWGITGVAVGVGTAIIYKYLAMVGLSLGIAGVSWRRYLAAQAPGLWLAAFVGLFALGVRWSGEWLHLGSLEIALAIVAVSAVALPAGIHFLPGRLRPSMLFDQLERSVSPLPAPVRLPLAWAMRRG